MKTTLDIPSALLSEAMRLAGAKTKRAAVLAALDDFSKRGRMREMAMRLGNSDTFMTAVDLETLRIQNLIYSLILTGDLPSTTNAGESVGCCQ